MISQKKHGVPGFGGSQASVVKPNHLPSSKESPAVRALLVEGNPLDQAIVLSVGRVLLHFALVIEDGLFLSAWATSARTRIHIHNHNNIYIYIYNMIYIHI